MVVHAFRKSAMKNHSRSIAPRVAASRRGGGKWGKISERIATRDGRSENSAGIARKILATRRAAIRSQDLRTNEREASISLASLRASNIHAEGARREAGRFLARLRFAVREKFIVGTI